MFESVVLGVVQGIAEFLPISSSAHLIIIPKLFKWPDSGLAFDVALHLGTLLAILIYFRKDWLKLIKSFFSSISKRKISTIDEKLAWFIVVGSIPGAIAGSLLEHKAESSFRNLLLIAITISVFGLIIYWFDRKSKRNKTLSAMTWKSALVIGFAQLLAIVPGVSRAGATMAGGLSQGLKREDAAKFSFLLAAPIMAGAGLLEIHKIVSQINFNVILSFAVAFGTGLLVIHLLLGYIRKNDFKVFVFYRIVLASVLLAFYIYGYR